jgi:hypothetical protein
VINHPKLGEVVEIRYDDGEVLYEPNDPVFQLSAGVPIEVGKNTVRTKSE